MRIKKIASFMNLQESHAKEIVKTYLDRGYEVEMIPVKIRYKSSVLIGEEDIYEIHIYELIKRSKRWYTINDNI